MRIAALVTAAGLLAVGAPAIFTSTSAHADPAHAVTITVDAANPGRVVPADFLGLSFEANLMHEQWLTPGSGNVPNLISNLGRGNLRFSANQVDRTAWLTGPDAPIPAWAADGQVVMPSDLARVGELARAIGWSVDMGVNLAHFDPATAADQARSAREHIGSSLRAVQIGNEPNVYIASGLIGSDDRRPYTPESYAVDAEAYRVAIAAAAPGTQIEGPDTVGAAVGVPLVDTAIAQGTAFPWLRAYAGRFGAQSTSLNQHYYPLVNVAKVGVPESAADTLGALPTVERLLDPDTSRRQTAFIREFVGIAQEAGLRPRLTETNSVAKEGRSGVTDTFANALWTADYLMTAAREGVASVNLHMQPKFCESYTLFCFEDEAQVDAGIARPNPNYYAALAFSEFLGGQILPTTVTGGAQVSAFAVRLPDGTVKVLVDNLDSAFRGDVSVVVDRGELASSELDSGGLASDPAQVQRLAGGALDANSGTTFGGATVAADGSFTPGAPVSLAAGPTGYALPIDSPGAAVLTIG